MSAPSFCKALDPCASHLEMALETLRADVSPDALLDFFDSLSGPGSGTLRDLTALAKIKRIRFARLPWRTQTVIKRGTLILPYPRLRAKHYDEDLARIYLSIFETLRLRALRKSATPFLTSLPDYQERVAQTLARSEFHTYDVLFYLAPHLLEKDVTQSGVNDISFRDRRRLTSGELPSFVKPTLERALNGWVNANPTDTDAAVRALEQNVEREKLNFLWFGDLESRAKRGFWRGVRYATIASGLFSVYQVGPEIALLWNARHQIIEAASKTIVMDLTPEDLAEGRRSMHEFYLRKIAETQKVLSQHPRSESALADLAYYTQRARETK